MATILDARALHAKARGALLASNWWAAAVRGVTAVILGSLALLAPGLTLVGLVMIFAAYCVVDGIFAIILAIQGARRQERWGWLAFNGVISLAAATVAALYPTITIFALVIVFAAWALVSGAATIAAGVELSKGHGRWWLIAGGAIAVVFGLLAILWPAVGMLTLSYLIGFQALLAGFTLLVLAFQLRARNVELSRGSDSAAKASPGTSSEEGRHG